MADEFDDPAFHLVGLAAEPVAPPPGLRDRVLAGARVAQGNRIVQVPAGTWRARAGVPLGAVAALVVVALLAGLVVGERLGQSVAPPAQPQVAHFMLTGHGSMDGASATVVDVKKDGVALVTFYGLPAVPAGKLYEIWLITPESKAVPAAVFVPDENGQQFVVIEKPLEGFKLMAVTVEDAPSGVDQPTQQPQLLGSIA